MIKCDYAKDIISKNKIVSVIRSNNFNEAIKTAESCIAGGIKVIEITFTIPRPHRIIEHLSEKYEGTDVIIGAGTVLDSETARIAMLSGADFIVSPTVDKGMIEICNRYDILSVPGISTPADVKYAKECGARMVKLFPTANVSPKMVSILRGPFPHTDFMVSGTMDESTAKEWIIMGASAVGIGSAICASAKFKDYETVKKKANDFITAVCEI